MDSVVELPCPVCNVENNLMMRAHSAEIPYFGEHTQVTLMCDSCGWRQTDFIPADGAKPGGWSLCIDESSKLSARIVRSSSCTVCIPELDLEVNPGSSNAGYVTNSEGILLRFTEVVEMIARDLRTDGDDEVLRRCDELSASIIAVKSGDFEQPLHIVLLDPRGRSQILHENAMPRELTAEELERLPVGPDPAIFSPDEV
ncbi:MAG: ZPR1 zinc finger domain-containing protein [Candidatus Poseidoniales archaeon]|nr:ZPR1 zinc finger domain-containing protein [Candidatus Poseidoniales archaeon]